jgi:hypothetical protein
MLLDKVTPCLGERLNGHSHPEYLDHCLRQVPNFLVSALNSLGFWFLITSVIAPSVDGRVHGSSYRQRTFALSLTLCFTAPCSWSEDAQWCSLGSDKLTRSRRSVAELGGLGRAQVASMAREALGLISLWAANGARRINSIECKYAIKLVNA